MSERNAWHAVVQLIEGAGVDVVFGLPADDVMLIDAVEASGVRMVVCRDQRNAAFAATGYALQTGLPGVCLVGKGPAVANTVTGLLEARYAGAPLVVIAAGTASDRLGTGALQEVDQLALVSSVTKAAWRVESAERLLPGVDRALLVAAAGAPGPAYLEVPDHLLAAELPARAELPPALTRLSSRPDDLVGRLRAAQRPVLLVGGGMRHRNRDRSVEQLAQRLGAAVFVTASGRGAFDEASSHFCGLAGLYSPAEMAQLWAQTDLVVSLGSRLEETAVEAPGFCSPDTEVLQVNLREEDFSTAYPGALCLSDGEAFVRDVLSGTDGASLARPGWTSQVAAARKAAFARAGAADRPAELGVRELLSALDEVLPEDRILVQENGLADMWSYFYPSWTVEACAGSVVPSEQTTLGFGAAAASGVALGAPGRMVVALVGDGAFDMVRNDVATFAAARIPVLYLVLRNGGYGWLQNQLDKRRAGEPTDYSFSGDDGRSYAGGWGPGVFAAVLREPDQLLRTLVEAVEACRAGNLVVLEVPVTEHDGALYEEPAVPVALESVQG